MPKIISRKDWGARAPRNRYTVTWAQRSEFFVHHTEGPTDQTIKSIQNFHMDGNRWSDIGYNHLVGDDGTIYEGRGWLVVGAHCPNHNRIGHSVAYIGKNAPTEAALRSIRWLYDEACRRAKKKLKILGHGERFATACPGTRLQAWVAKGMPVDGPETKPVPAPKPIKIVWDGDVPRWPGRVLAYDPGEPMLRGEDVKAWQTKIDKRGWTIDVDGVYGPQSRGVCRSYQHATGLEPTGEVDGPTWEMTWSWRPPAAAD